MKSKNIYQNLEEYIKKKSKTIIKDKEGHIDESQVDFFINLLKKNKWIKKIGETGFNQGHSSASFLNNSKKTKIWSFDSNIHTYTNLGKKFIDMNFPKRHELICGDSTKTLRQFKKKNKNFSFDLIFIDGGHSYRVSKEDIENMKELSNNKKILVIDDILPNRAWGVGPTKALEELVEKGVIGNVKFFDNFEALGKITRRWIMAKYIFKDK